MKELTATLDKIGEKRYVLTLINEMEKPLNHPSNFKVFEGTPKQIFSKIFMMKVDKKDIKVIK